MRKATGPLGPIPPATRERPKPRFKIIYPEGWKIRERLDADRKQSERGKSS